jgi:hypothetical protein
MVQTLRLFFVIVLVIGAVDFINGQTQVTFGASKDNTLYESTTGALSNGVGAHFFAGRTLQPVGSSIRRGLLAFDVAASIPGGSTITNVLLTLNMSKTNVFAGAQTVSLHRALAYWGEGTSDAFGEEGAGAPATPDDATWVHRFFDTVFWDVVGGDYTPASSASQTVSNVGLYTWGSTPQMVADVQLWLDSASSNHGWVIIGNEATAPSAKRFDSRENPNPAVQPMLTVTFTTVGVEEDKENIPRTYELYQNYPNPFNPVTHIKYQIPRASYVTLKVLNLLGQEVATLADGEQRPGEYAVQWRPARTTSGVYFYRLVASPVQPSSAGEFVATKKLLLVK